MGLRRVAVSQDEILQKERRISQLEVELQQEWGVCCSLLRMASSPSTHPPIRSHSLSQ